MEEFNYIIARPWVEGESQLCTYAYGHEVFFDDMEHAVEMRDFINGRCDKVDTGKYQIYKIELTPTI